MHEKKCPDEGDKLSRWDFHGNDWKRKIYFNCLPSSQCATQPKRRANRHSTLWLNFRIHMLWGSVTGLRYHCYNIELLLIIYSGQTLPMLIVGGQHLVIVAVRKLYTSFTQSEVETLCWVCIKTAGIRRYPDNQVASFQQDLLQKGDSTVTNQLSWKQPDQMEI